MPGKPYRLLTEWRIEGKCDEIWSLLREAQSFPRWWPEVYLGATVLAAGDAKGAGKTVEFQTKIRGRKRPLRWRLHIVACCAPTLLCFETTGDLAGHGRWRLEPHDRLVVATHDWTVRPENLGPGPLRLLLKLVFEANHRWGMSQGRARLQEELERRRAQERLKAVPRLVRPAVG